jgi:hypothetical protein
MIVKLFDKTELTISTNAAVKLTESLQRDPQGYVTINGMVIKKTAIAMIKPGGEVLANAVALIERPDHRGEYSPAKEKLRKMFAK